MCVTCVPLCLGAFVPLVLWAFVPLSLCASVGPVGRRVSCVCVFPVSLCASEPLGLCASVCMCVAVCQV